LARKGNRMNESCAFCGKPCELLCNHQIGQSSDRTHVFKCDLAICRKCADPDGRCPFHTGKLHNQQTLSLNGVKSMRGNLQHLADVARLKPEDAFPVRFDGEVVAATPAQASMFDLAVTA
jgi:hypothetical protein